MFQIIILLAIFTTLTSHEIDKKDKEHSDNSTHPKPLEINITVVYLKLIEVSEPEEKVTFIIDYDMSWRDFRVSWDPETYGNITYFSLPRTKVWIPQLQIVNTHSLVDYRPEYQQLAMLNTDGTVSFHVSNVASIVCNMEVGDFPFDKQKCELMLVSNAYRKHEVNVNLDEYDIHALPRNLVETGFDMGKRKVSLTCCKVSIFSGASQEVKGTGEWQMLNVSAEKELIPFDGCHVEINKYVIILKRNSAFYVTMIIIPYFVINVLSIIGMFLVRHERLGKLSISLTNLMSTTFILSILTESVPKTQKLSLLSIYVIINLSIILAAVLGTIVIPICYQRYKQHLRKEVTSQKYEKPENPTIPVQPVKEYFIDKGNWNRLFFVALQTANVLNFVYIFM